jgi:propanol-preferring alcohol dehydrogenase
MLLQRPAPVASGPLQPVELPDPEPADDEIVLEVAACAVCRTDLQICEGDVVPRRLPIVPGHQAVGRVVAVGAAASGWRLGERAGVGWLGGTCGVCRFCRSQRENLCERAAFTGWDRNGGYAERIAVRADFALRLPERMTDAQAAPLLCGGVIGYRSLRVSGIAPGGRLGLYGFGASALLTIQVALHWGCEVYVATRSRAERERALGLGAVWAGGADESPPRPLDAAITFAPVGEVVLAALGALDRGGAVAVNAIHIDRIPEFPYERLWWERSLRSVANFTRRDAREFLDLAAAIPIRTEIDERPLQAANETLADLSAGRVRGAAVLVP